MKVLFIFKSENFLAPIGLCSISAIARKGGHEVHLCEVNTADPLGRTKALEPDIVAYSSSTGEAKHYLKINQSIKKALPDVFTVMGGPHPTFYPEVVLEGALDAACAGEGEGAFAELLHAVKNKMAPESIPNIVTAKNRQHFSLRHLVEDIDSLPFPDYALLYDNTPMGSYPLKNFITSRGCPYDCTYCFNASWRKMYEGLGSAVRRHSVDYVIDDIKQVRSRWPLSFVKFYDDIFTYRADDWLEEFSTKYRRQIGLPFFILTRADLLTEDMVRLLKEAGCQTISMSIEAGNAEVRAELLKRRMSDEQIIFAHRLCDKYGIRTFTNCIVGLPGTTISDDIKSLDLAIRSRATWAEFLIFHPYPKTELGEQTIRQGFYDPDYNRMHTSYMYRSPLKCFSERQKNAQMNFSVLGAVAVAMPFLRTPIARILIYCRHNFLFTLLYYTVKMYVLRKKIYVTRTTFSNSLRIFLRSLRQEWFRHENRQG